MLEPNRRVYSSVVQGGAERNCTPPIGKWTSGANPACGAAGYSIILIQYFCSDLYSSGSAIYPSAIRHPLLFMRCKCKVTPMAWQPRKIFIGCLLTVPDIYFYNTSFSLSFEKLFRRTRSDQNGEKTGHIDFHRKREYLKMQPIFQLWVFVGDEDAEKTLA